MKRLEAAGSKPINLRRCAALSLRFGEKRQRTTMIAGAMKRFGADQSVIYSRQN